MDPANVTSPLSVRQQVAKQKQKDLIKPIAFLCPCVLSTVLHRKPTLSFNLPLLRFPEPPSLDCRSPGSDKIG
jgi:hypothetical protein